MGNNFTGFGTMAAAMAAAGLGMPAPVVAAAASVGMKFLLIDRFGWRTIVQDMGNGYYRTRRGHDYEVNKEIFIVESTYAASWSALDMDFRKKASSYVEGGDAGWLDRDGNFYSCRFGGHSGLLENVLYKEWEEVEKEGWVHVDNAPSKGEYTFRYATGPRTLLGMSPKQVAWLKEHGHDLNPYNREEESIILGEYKLDAAADAAAFDREMRKAGLDPAQYRKPASRSRLADFR